MRKAKKSCHWINLCFFFTLLSLVSWTWSCHCAVGGWVMLKGKWQWRWCQQNSCQFELSACFQISNALLPPPTSNVMWMTCENSQDAAVVGKREHFFGASPSPALRNFKGGILISLDCFTDFMWSSWPFQLPPRVFIQYCFQVLTNTQTTSLKWVSFLYKQLLSLKLG